jgi:flagellar protein FliS
MTPRHALNAYAQTRVAAGAAYADPHTLIGMLFEGLREKLAVAKGAIKRKDYSLKGRAIGSAMDIVTYLQSCLDKRNGGEIAENLDALYEYMIGRLLLASSGNQSDLLDEVGGLLREIESAWSAIRVTANKAQNPAVSVGF